MANIKKNFNFRNGVQVDDDNLLVTSTGLVGIGPTVPTEALDVRGNVKIIGDATITGATIGVVTLTELAPTQIIGAGVSIKSGIITAQGTGIVTFYGDGRFLQGLPTSQWEDTNAGFGVSSIYNTGGTVGIATTNPQFTLQIGENPNQIGGVSGDGVGISSVGNIKASGIVTASIFSGNVDGNVTGNVTGNVAGDLQGNIVGPSVFSGNIDLNADIDVDGHTNLDNLSVAGVSTFAGKVTTQEDVDIEMSSTFAYYDISSNTFEMGLKNGFSGRGVVVGFGSENQSSSLSLFYSGHDSYIRNTGTYQPESELRLISGGSAVRIGKGTTAGAVVSIANTDLSIVNSTSAMFDIGADLLYNNVLKLSTASSGINVVGTTTTGQLAVTGISTFTGNIDANGDLDVDGHTNLDNISIAGVSTFTGDATFSGNALANAIGVGTDTPVNDIQVRKNANVEIQVTSDTGSAGLTVGRESGTNNTNNAEFRYGLVSGGAPYSSSQSLDILNYGTGNFNYHLSANNPSGVNGDFHWHKGLNTRLMTLTGIGGSLGIGVTTPSTKFEVVGNSKFSGSVEITNNLTLSGSLNISAVNANLTGNVTGNLFGLIDTPVSGISTINHLRVGQGLGIGVTDAGNKFNLGSTPDNRIFINNNSQIGIKTDTISDPNVVVEIIGNVRLKKAVSVGNTTRSAVDFSDAVNITNEGETGLPFNRSQLAYMIPPRVTTAQRNLLRDAYTNSATLLSGAMVYNTSINKLQVWNGSAWETITSS